MKDEVKKVLFIVNKFSGRGYQPSIDGKLISACERADVECHIEFTRARGHATSLANDAALSRTFDAVVAVGGDGTVNEVAQGLLHSGVHMGIIPKGSGNGLARHLMIPMNFNRAVASFFNSEPLAMDAFKVNGKLSLNVSGIGFDGHVANLFGNEKKRGLQGYARLVMKEFFSFREFPVRITIADKTIERSAFVLAIANSSQYGNNARVAPAASVCDELLHLNIIRKVPPYRLDFIFSFFAGTADKFSFCEILVTDKAEIELPAPMAYHIDGEPCGHSDRFDIRILPKALSMLVPREAKRAL